MRSLVNGPGQGRGEEKKGRVAVHGVHYHLIVENDKPGQLHIELEVGPGRRGLRVEVKPHGDDLAQVPAQEPGGQSGGDKFVLPARGGHTAPGDGDLVLAEELAGQAGDGANLALGQGGRDDGVPARGEGEGVEVEQGSGDLGHSGKPGQLGAYVRTDVDVEAEVGGVGTGQERRVRRRRTSCGGQRPQAGPARQPDYQH